MGEWLAFISSGTILLLTNSHTGCNIAGTKVDMFSKSFLEYIVCWPIFEPLKEMVSSYLTVPVITETNGAYK